MLAAQKVEGSYASDIALLYMEVLTYEREVCVFHLETECSADVQCEWDSDHTKCTFSRTWAFTSYSNACFSKTDQAKKTRDTILAGITNARMKKKAELLANAAIAGVKVNKLTAKLEAADEATACSNQMPIPSPTCDRAWGHASQRRPRRAEGSLWRCMTWSFS